MHTTKTGVQRHYYYSPNIQRRPVPRRSAPRLFFRRVIMGTLVLGLAFWGLSTIFGQPDPKDTNVLSSQSQAAATNSKPAEPIIPKISSQEMTAKMNEIINANPDVDISVSVVDLKNNKSYHYGTDAVFEAASVAKLLSAITYLHQVEAGDVSLRDYIGGMTAQESLKIMIEKSDNAAWKSINDRVSHENLLSYVISLGITKYDPEVNTLGTEAIAKIVSRFYQGKLLNQEHTQLLLSYMKNANATEYIKAALPQGVNFYHKAGWLQDRAHDAAIIDDGKNPYVLVIFTNGQGKHHPISRTALMNQITKVTVGHFISSDKM